MVPATRIGGSCGPRPVTTRAKGVGVKGGLPDIDWVPIPDDGEFIYQEDEHRTKPRFWIAHYPVTYAQWRAFVEAADGFQGRSLVAGTDAAGNPLKVIGMRRANNGSSIGTIPPKV